MLEISIEDFLQDLERERAHLEAVRDARIETATRERKRLEANAAQTEREIRSRQELRAGLMAAGASTKEIDAQIEGLEKSLSATKDAIAAATQEEQSAKSGGPASGLHSIEDLARHLNRRGCSTALVVDDVQELVQHIPVDFEAENVGRPKVAILHLGANVQIRVPVVPGHRVLSDYYPEALNWLGAVPPEAHPRTDTHKFRAVYLKGTKERLLSEVVFHESSAVPSHYAGHRTEPVAFDFSHLAVGLAKRLGELASPETAPLDLDASHEPGSLRSVLCERILSATTAEPRFCPNSARLRSSEIEQVIAPQWRAFVSAPWHAGITKQLALLKYLAENGEKPRFWNASFIGHYGFRMRTRDHNWLVGEIYLAPTRETQPSAEPHIEVRGDDYRHTVAAIGTTTLRVRKEE